MSTTIASEGIESTTIAPPKWETMADLLRELGDVPPERVRLRPAPGTATEEDVLAIADQEDRLFELVEGTLVEKAMGFPESLLAAMLIRLIGGYLDDQDLGIVVGADAMMRLAPHLVRMPDVSFISWDHMPGRRVPTEPIAGLAPDLAVEVLSRGNTEREMERKLREYFEAGVRLVWLIDHRERSARAVAAQGEAITVKEDELLEGGDVLPGFQLRLSELLAQLDRHG